MPTYNGSRFIEDAIESLQTQDGVSPEIIVVDDGSTDGCDRIVEKIAGQDARVILLRQEHQGVATARNTGLRVASKNYITFLDSDDICAPGKIRRQISKLIARPDITSVVGQRIYFNAMTPELLPVDGSIWYRKLDICLASAVFRRETFERFGAFDENLVYGEDIDFYFRLFEADARFIIEMETAIYYRRHSANMTNDEGAMHKACLRAYHNSMVRRRTTGRTRPLDVFFFRKFDRETEFGGPASSEPVL
jgi:glycosyltransferase involved in cell wall biosynthesis